jgi:cysteine synthase A
MEQQNDSRHAVHIRQISKGNSTILLAKLEGRNFGILTADRLAEHLICEAEQRGALQPGIEIIEASFGSTGLALATAAAQHGYKLSLVMPETVDIERRNAFSAAGATVILSRAEEGLKGALQLAEEIADADPHKYFLLQKFKNPDNAAFHEKITGPELWNETGGAIDVFVSAVGTGGTLTGVSRYIKNIMGKQILSVAVEPKESPVISQKLSGQKIKVSPHRIVGAGAGFIPDTLDLLLVDRVEQVSAEEALDVARRLATEEELTVDISSAAAVAGALRLTQLEAFAGKTIVVILSAPADTLPPPTHV